MDALRVLKPDRGASKPHNIGCRMKHQRISTVVLKGFVLVGTHSPVVSVGGEMCGHCKILMRALGDGIVISSST